MDSMNKTLHRLVTVVSFCAMVMCAAMLYAKLSDVRRIMVTFDPECGSLLLSATMTTDAPHALRCINTALAYLEANGLTDGDAAQMYNDLKKAQNTLANDSLALNDIKPAVLDATGIKDVSSRVLSQHWFLGLVCGMLLSIIVFSVMVSGYQDDVVVDVPPVKNPPAKK